MTGKLDIASGRSLGLFERARTTVNYSLFPMKKLFLIHAAQRLLPALLLPLASLAIAQQQYSHSHGRLTLEVAVDHQTITLTMEAPLETFLGFERAPQTDAERKSVAAMVARLNAADTLFIPDPRAECRLSKVTLESAVLGLGDIAKGDAAPIQGAVAKGQPAQDEHADIDVSIVFACAKATLARQIDVKLFDAFKGIRSIDAQVASTQGQFKRSLNKAAPRLTLGQ